MQEDIDFYFQEAEEGMAHGIDHLKKELQKVRTGKANTNLVSGLMVSYYGSDTPLNQVANVSTADSRTIIIQPWEKSMIAPIERAIFEANLGVTPQNDGELVRISIPPLTEERRRELVKTSKAMGEDAKVSMRSGRKGLMDSIKKAVKDGYPEDLGKDAESRADELTKKYTVVIDELLKTKEADILTI